MKYILSGILCYLPLSLYSQQTTFNMNHYGVEEGLLSSEIYCMIEDSEGYFWFGTESGISCFNGYDFVNYTVRDGLTKNPVFLITEDYAGRIWYSCHGGGIGYVYNQKVNPYIYNDTLKKIVDNSSWLDNLEVRSDGSICFSHFRHGTGSIDSKGILEYNRTLKLIELQQEIEANPKRKKWKIYWAIQDGANYLQMETENEIKFSKRNVGAPNIYPTVLSDGRILFFSRNMFVMIDDDQIALKEFDNTINDFALDQDGRPWVCTYNSGIQVFQSIKMLFQKEEPTQLFRDINISKIIHKANGSSWIATESSGVYFIYDRKVETNSGNSKLRSNVTTIGSNSRNEIFYSTEIGGLFKIDTEGNHLLVDSSAKDATQIEIINDRKIVVSKFNLTSSTKHSSLDEIQVLFGRGFYYATDSLYWIISPSQLSKYENDVNTFKSTGKIFFRTIFMDSNGILWVGGNNGLSIYKEDSLVNANHLLPPIENVTISDICEIDSCNILITSVNNGLFLLTRRNGTYSCLNYRLEDFILEKTLFELEDSTLWLATNRGVVTLEFDSELNVEIRKMGFINGLPSNEVNDLTIADDWVHVATNNGLAKFHKSRIKKQKTIPKISLMPISVNEKSLSKHEGNELNHDQNNIKFSFLGIAYGHSKNLMYRYMLKGVDTKWQYTQSREIRYPKLQAGKFKFMVSVSQENGIWSPTKTIDFKINKPMWLKWWFILLSLIFLSLIGLFLYDRRKTRINNRLLTQQKIETQKRKLIEAKLTALRSQMNPHFTFNTLNAIQNIMLNSNLEEALENISNFSILLRKILENSDKSFVTIKEEQNILKLYIDLENIRFDYTLNYQFKVDNSIDQDFQKIPSMIIQPFVENAIIHGLSGKRHGEKNISIEICDRETDVLCVIEDSGIGRIQAEKNKIASGLNHESLGIEIANQRLSLLSNELNTYPHFAIIDLYDENNKAMGTRVEISFKKDYYENE